MIAKMSLDSAKALGKNKLITKVGTRNKQVVLLVSVDNTNIQEAIEFSFGNKNIASLIYEGTEHHFSMLSSLDTKGLYICKVEQVASDVTEQDIVELLNVLPDWVTLVVDLPEDYNNMEFIYNICKSHSRVRFTGGYFFELEGCNLGICDTAILDKLGLKGDGELIRKGHCSALEVVDSDDIVITVATTKERVSTSSGSKEPKKKTLMFSELLFGKPSAFGTSGGL